MSHLRASPTSRTMPHTVRGGCRVVRALCSADRNRSRMPPLALATACRAVPHPAGYMLIHDLPAGVYHLRLKRPYPSCSTPPQTVTIRVLAHNTSAIIAGAIVSDNTLLQSRMAAVALAPHAGAGAGAAAGGATAAAVSAIIPTVPVTVSSIAQEGEDLVIRVSGGSSGPGPASGRDVRVHIVANFFVPPWDLGANLSRITVAGLASSRWAVPRSRYLPSRTLGEELKYVLDRQAILKGDKPPLPGNLLPRPSLLLNPWSLGVVESTTQTAAAGTAYQQHTDGAQAYGAAGASATARAAPQATARQHASFISVDFMGRPSVCMYNLRPTGDTGVVRIPLATLATAGADLPATWDLYVSVAVLDASSTAGTSAIVPLPPVKAGATAASHFRDLTRAGTSLPIDSHVVHSNRVEAVTSPADAVRINTAGTFVKVRSPRVPLCIRHAHCGVHAPRSLWCAHIVSSPSHAAAAGGGVWQSGSRLLPLHRT